MIKRLLLEATVTGSSPVHGSVVLDLPVSTRPSFNLFITLSILQFV